MVEKEYESLNNILEATGDNGYSLADRIIIEKAFDELNKYRKLFATPLQGLIRELEKADKNKEVLKNINKIVADYYNGEIDDNTAFNIIDELLKDVDWRNKNEVK